jgi:protein TonB
MAPSPQQYVREVGAAPANPVQAAIPSATAGGTASQEGTISPEVRAIRDRYEQQISAWIQQHKYYPAAASGREGRAIIRMRIDRSGYVRYYAIEQSAGVQALDTAAVDMIRRANPVPAVPANYPAGNLVEFLIPITFKAP